MFLYDSPILPPGFSLPRKYWDGALSGALPLIPPWEFLCASMALSLSYYGAMMEKIKETVLVPFAIINDESGLYNEGWVVLACFDGRDQSGNPQVYLFDYSNPPKAGLASLQKFDNFDRWLAYAQEASAQYQAEYTEAHK